MRLYSFSSGVGRPGVGQAAAAPDELRARVAEDRVALPLAGGEVARAPPARRPSRRTRIWPQTNDFGKASSAISDRNQSPLASPSAAESHESSVIGAVSGAASDVDSISP